MKLIFKYMKPYLISILLIIGLTVAQVETELALPDYMSDIVTNGIQYGGIIEQVPKAITSEDMELVSQFMSDDIKEVKEAVKATNKEIKKEVKEIKQDVKQAKKELKSKKKSKKK